MDNEHVHVPADPPCNGCGWIPQYPRVIHQGKYRLYEKVNGDMRVQYMRDDKEEEDFFEIPAAFIKLEEKARMGKLSPMDMMREMMSMMRSML